MNYSMMKILLNKVLIFLGLIVSVILYIFVGLNWSLGFLLGIVAMLLNWKLLSIQNEKIIKGNKKSSFSYFFYIIRYALIAVILYLSFMFDNLSGYATIIGIIFSYIYILLFAFFISKKERGEEDA